MRYGLLTYSTTNLGDDIQSLAAEQFLPRTDVLVDRDRLDQCACVEPMALICNGWWTHRPAAWPPPARIRPLLISMHINHRAAARFTQPELREYYQRHGPVGCRDTHTLDMFLGNGIDAYFSGCLTLTFPRFEGPRGDQIVLADPLGTADRLNFAGKWWQSIPQTVRRSVLLVNHEVRADTPKPQRRTRAQWFLDLYSRARLVVTSRLHAALPCLALGTPVIFVETGYEPTRFGGLLDMLDCRRHGDVLAGRWDVDWFRSGSATAGDKFYALRQKLTDLVVGYFQSLSEECSACRQ